VSFVGDERHSFIVLEESLTMETIAEYRRSRTRPRRARSWRIRAMVAGWLKRT
jgi:hypothetical protein